MFCRQVQSGFFAAQRGKPYLLFSNCYFVVMIGGIKLRPVNQLDVSHRRFVARTFSAFENPDVSAGPAGIARPELIEQLTTVALLRVLLNARRRFATLSFLARVINGSATERNSFAFTRVVLMISCSTREAVMFLNMAVRCGLLRFSWRPLCRCRITLYLYLVCVLFRQHGHPS